MSIHPFVLVLGVGGRVANLRAVGWVVDLVLLCRWRASGLLFGGLPPPPFNNLIILSHSIRHLINHYHLIHSFSIISSFHLHFLPSYSLSPSISFSLFCCGSGGCCCLAGALCVRNCLIRHPEGLQHCTRGAGVPVVESKSMCVNSAS